MVDITKFWDEQAKKLDWFKPWKKVLDWHEPFAKWFVGGLLNASYLCLDVHRRKDKLAIQWEDEDGNSVSYTYQQLYEEVNRCASALKKLGVTKGDRVVIFLPMIPQAVVAMLAVSRLGAIHSVVFSAFGYSALADRINDAQARFIITADFGKRRGKLIPLKKVVDQALAHSSVERVIVVRCTGQDIPFNESRDCWYDEILKDADAYVAPVPVEATHPLFLLYTSGSTGKPKGIEHATGGYLVYVHFSWNYAFRVKDDDLYWCTADFGWITGHSCVVYGPLLHGASIFLYEGAPDYPTGDQWLRLIKKYKVSIFYTSPTALRMLMKQVSLRQDMSSLRLLGTAGEVLNPEVWKWFYEEIGNKKCPILDTWWQTETGGFMIAPSVENFGKLKPGSVSLPYPGIEVDVVDEQGKSVAPNVRGFLVIKKPWPGMLMGIYGDPERYKEVYWSKFKGMYYSGDYAKRDEDGYFWLLGRADEVLKVASHLLGTAEIESAALAAPCVAEAAVVGVPDDIKGEAIVLFVVLKGDVGTEREISDSIRYHLGAIALPKEIHFVKSLPKTRSGKILRRVLKAQAMGEDMGDISTLADES